MTNTRTILGAAGWALMSLMLAFATFEPVEAAGPCPHARTGQVCADLASGTPGCEPLLA